MDTEHLLTTTRSARRSLDLNAHVDYAEVRDCPRIGLQAANGSNQQTWRWVVVADAGLRQSIADLHRAAYLSMVGGQMISESLDDDEFGRVMISTEWLVEHLAQVPLHVIPGYEPYLPSFGEGDGSFQRATLYGSIYPSVWNFQLALHEKGYGTCVTTMHLLREGDVGSLLGIPETAVQACLLPVARLRRGTRFGPAPRRPVKDVVALDRWAGTAFCESANGTQQHRKGLKGTDARGVHQLHPGHDAIVRDAAVPLAQCHPELKAREV